MNTELEAYFAAARAAAVTPPEESEERQREREEFPSMFIRKADSLFKPVMEGTAATLQKHGYASTVELVREQGGSNPNTFPYITLHFSAQRCSPSDLGYIYTLAGASITFICRRSDLCVEVVTAHPAGKGHERRVNFSTVGLGDLTQERVSAIVTEAVKQIIRL
jgi:hypothetical protein